jgi:hypothetical protein
MPKTDSRERIVPNLRVVVAPAPRHIRGGPFLKIHSGFDDVDQGATPRLPV